MTRADAQQQLHQEVIMAGFGGQGALTMGQTLAEAAMLEGYQVVWVPAYGPEMRGGPAFCAIIVSSDPIGSPAVTRVNAALIMDQPSLSKYQGQVQPGGLVLINSSLVTLRDPRPDVQYYAIRANHLAEELGDARITNMVMLGAYLQLSQIVTPGGIVRALEHMLPERRRHLIPLNEQGLAAGAASIETLACFA